MDETKQLIRTADWTDKDRMEYIKELDESVGKEVSNWEAEFIGSLMQQERNVASFKRNLTLSPKQRIVIENLYEKYRD
jgi:hypothetical protein